MQKLSIKEQLHIGDAVADYRAENNMPPSTVHIDAPPQHVEINVDLAEGEHFPDNPPTSEDITIDTLERLDELEPSDCGEYGVFKQYATVLICQDRRRTTQAYIALDKTEGFYFGVNYQMHNYGGSFGAGKINEPSYTTWKLALHAAIVYLMEEIEGNGEDGFCRKVCEKWNGVFDDLWKKLDSIKQKFASKISEDIENNTGHTITEKTKNYKH